MPPAKGPPRSKRRPATSKQSSKTRAHFWVTHKVRPGIVVDVQPEVIIRKLQPRIAKAVAEEQAKICAEVRKKPEVKHVKPKSRAEHFYWEVRKGERIFSFMEYQPPAEERTPHGYYEHYKWGVRLELEWFETSVRITQKHVEQQIARLQAEINQLKRLNLNIFRLPKRLWQLRKLRRELRMFLEMQRRVVPELIRRFDAYEASAREFLKELGKLHAEFRNKPNDFEHGGRFFEKVKPYLDNYWTRREEFIKIEPTVGAPVKYEEPLYGYVDKRRGLHRGF
jgi:hypothetical protein